MKGKPISTIALMHYWEWATELARKERTMNELKPCPFCGEREMLEVEVKDHGEEKRPFGYRWTAKVVCLNCFASCGTHGFQHNEESGKRMAIRAWNRRSDNEQR